jgi:hypothetical protein
MDVKNLLSEFVAQAKTGDLKTASYPKNFKGYTSKVSFGMGAPARIPWIALTAPEISVSNGYFPVYLFYKDLNTLILSYGISETNEFELPWTPEIENRYQTIESYFGKKVPRYGNSYVFRAYKVADDGSLSAAEDASGKPLTAEQLEQDLNTILDDYQKATNSQVTNPQSVISQGVFYLEKQLEDFIISNWVNTELGEDLELIVKDGELVSQQYRTDIGPIDILAKDKKTGAHVVIELKKGQTSDDTIGQITRYMGWVEEKLNDRSVRGIIIANGFDKKLEYALKRVSGVDVFIYEIDFRLKEFTGV